MKHYIGEVGTDIILETGKALAGATLLNIKYQKPDGTTGSWTGTIDTATKVKYTLSSGDIDQAGVWTFQAYVEVAGGKWYGQTARLTFSALFDESAFTDLTIVKGMIGQSSDQTDDDAIIESLIMQSTKKVQTHTRRNLFYGTYTEYYDGNEQSSIFIDNFPIEAVTTLHDDTDRVFGASTLIASAEYFTDLTKGIIKLLDGDRFSVGVGNIKVVYTGGFKVIPADIQLACSQLVLADYIEIKGGINVLEGETVTYKPGNLRSQAFKTLDLYQKMSVL